MEKSVEAKLRQEHGELVVAKIAGVEFAFKTPTDTDYEEMQEGILKAGNDKKRIGPVFRQYCMSALVHPTTDELETALRKQPAAAARIADALSDLAGAEIEISVKKG